MMPARIELDFAAASPRFSVVGLIVLALGAAAAAWTVSDYRALQTQSALLDIEVGAAAPRSTDTRRSTEIDPRGIVEATAAVAELSLPWSQLLNDLETIAEESRNDIALLSIEPDREKRRVRIGAEASSLPAALAFVQKLQRTSALEYPLLDNHQVRTDQRERPVYFEMTADWSLAQ